MINRNKIAWFLILFVCWIILFGYVDVFVIVSGVIVCLLALWFSDTYLLKSPIEKLYHINLIKLVRYILMLILEIYASGVDTIMLIVKGNINPKIVAIKTELDSPFERALLANSITLTPGTVTIDQQDDQLIVLWLDAKSSDPAVAGELIKGRLERRLKRGVGDV